MITDYYAIIIGAGPAGLFAACNIKAGNILIIEKNPAAGRKLLISGAGQCNYTHSGDIDEFITKYGDNGSFLKHALYSFDNTDAICFFKANGVESIIREDGKVFPESLRADDILQTLISKCKDNKVCFKYNTAATSVSYNNDLKYFSVKTNGEKFTCINLIISTGGASYKNTGSTGDGYSFADMLGHKVVHPYPCLTPVNVKDYSFGNLSGTSFCNITISLYRDNKKLKEYTGDLLLTHKNISGPGMLNFSRYVRAGDTLKINFIGLSIEELKKMVEKVISDSGKQSFKSIFINRGLSKRFIEKIFETNHISQNILCSQISKKDKLTIIKSLCEYSFEVESLGDYHIAMATNGGVSLDEVNRKTMESKIIKGLYFAGEVLDIDGDTGGYNIHAAFSTALSAANNINKNYV